MISNPKKMEEYIKKHIEHAEKTVVFLRGATENDYVFQDVANANLFHYSRFKGMQDMLVQLIGVRHILELDIDDMLNSPISSYREYDLEGVRECIPMLRQGVSKVAAHSREIHDLTEGLKKQYGNKDDE